VAPEGESERRHTDIGESAPAGGVAWRLGITTPVLTLLPDAHSEWEVDASIEDVAAIARRADSLGYDHLTCSEHVVVPTDVAPVRGGRYYDPLATFGYLAAQTSALKLATNVLVLGYHHPLEIAKRYGTLDRISGGRVILGLGVGSLQEEFELLGAPFEDRGARADDAIKALRVSWSEPRPAYDGRYYRYSDVVLDPCATERSVPLWIGGRTRRSLRRAVELADGWVPFAITAAELTVMLDDARATDAWAARERPIEIILRNGRPADPLGDPDSARRMLGRLRGLGATGVQLSFVHGSLDHYLEQLEAMAGVAGEEGGP
jgi:probable F420-dependent oxidoreductase